MIIVYALFFFIFGLVFGSFFNVVGLRVPKGESIVSPPSHCTNCQRRLTTRDLVPVLSFLFLKGKCRKCETKIHWVYPLTEFVTAFLFTLAYLELGLNPELIIALLFISLLIIITVSDIAYMLIPNKILLVFGVLLVVGRFFIQSNPWWDSIVGAFGGFLILLLVAILSKGGIGGGDIKLFFIIGLVLGIYSTLLALFLASVIGLIVGVVLLNYRKQGRKTPIPFGPSIALASIITYFYGEQILEWYMNLLF
ncbi:prepilin peptidase [Viridibacillus sp. FSL R5-0477]|uniref:Type 4 prepilin-like proteins leader peptide processing enzyme n=1 Tax=Viridibacillus arenosi FSL R5-213 TaxID=1227360 RepID=W4EPF3_9BACL|nr:MULTISPECIES: A24 family peptidase [Viridibacillus]ETT82463.1 type 4 prepilin-like proteins leader peptide processing enzyme [Viridibacillus arenosi FSL R5-213]OMC85436.1 prepilin peptidase [Viridibacillus sp. FSL H8-0123]OMC87286.1 prepilin peptidase [Viridibacillus sp. FSL H7-0596]OMC92447.1 prepilin peptidase [Viridibacillus arenosi]